MRTGTKKPAGFILFLFAAIASAASVIDTQRAQAAYVVETDTGRPQVLINRPLCGSDGFPDESSRCQFIEGPPLRDRLWSRPDP